ncbi:unnamed protein product [Mucor hiemalis]
MRFIYIYLTCLYFILHTVLAQAPAQTPAPAPASSNSNPVLSTTQAPGQQPSNIPQLPGNNTNPIVNGTLPNNNGTAVNGTQPNAGANNTLAGLPTSASYGNSVYPGTATFATPTASKSVSPLYRIDPRENVTFVWSFTNLLVRPSNLTLAAVGPNSVTYTITALPGDATSAVWHIKDVPPASPLMMGMYQVQLYDQRGPTAAPQPGWLAPVTRLTIAFYSAESYQPLTGCKYLS